MKWSDGVPLTAADVAYTFQRDTVPGSTELADNSAYVANIVPSSVKAIGQYTVADAGDQADANMDLLIVSILPKHIWEHVSEKQVSELPERQPGRRGPVHGEQLQAEPVGDAEGESALLGRQARDLQAGLPELHQPERQRRSR